MYRSLVLASRPGAAAACVRAHGRALAALFAFAAGGCGADAPTGVPGATPYAPPAAYAFWWSLVEQCSGLRGDLAAVRWARVPGASIPGTPDLGSGGAQGQWDPASNTITVVVRNTAAGPLIRHEMLHALLGPGYAGAHPHPAAYFGARCGGTVGCGGPCRAEVAADTPAPPDAPALRPDDLALSARVVAPARGTAAAGGAYAVVVTATAPAGPGGWVPRAADPDAAESPDFGYALTWAAFPDVPLAVVNAGPGARTYFAGGETKRFVFDVGAADTDNYPAGAYALRGSFAGALSAPTSVALPP